MEFKNLKEYTREELEKHDFVELALSRAVRMATDGECAELLYLTDKESDYEAVRVKTRTLRSFDVNVSCDSRLAIAADVFKAIAEQ